MRERRDCDGTPQHYRLCFQQGQRPQKDMHSLFGAYATSKKDRREFSVIPLDREIGQAYPVVDNRCLLCVQSCLSIYIL